MKAPRFAILTDREIFFDGHVGTTPLRLGLLDEEGKQLGDTPIEQVDRDAPRERSSGRGSTMFTHRDRRSSRNQSIPRRRATPLLAEALEQRNLLAVMVTTPADNGNNLSPTPGSLRAALLAANATPGSEIDFQLQPGDVIKPKSPLPAISADQTHIVGTGDFLIDGSLAGNTDGLVITGNQCDIAGLYIGKFALAGIHIEGNNESIRGCDIGFTPAAKPAPNGTGIFVDGSFNITIDDTQVDTNKGDGIDVLNSGQVRIKSSIAPALGQVIGNGGDGIHIVGMIPTLPGVDILNTQVTGNIIDKNHGAGVHIIDASFNRIGLPTQNGYNWIGPEYQGNPDSLKNSGNLGDGVRIESSQAGISSANLVAFNYIAGNHGNGVDLIGQNTYSNSIVQNRIGLTADYIPEKHDPSMAALGNLHAGVLLTGGANNNNIGGTGLFEAKDADEGPNIGDGNVIVANGDSGVRIAGSGTTVNVVQGNMIGTAAGEYYDFGLQGAIPNLADGVLIEMGAAGNIVGGTGQTVVTTGHGNLISGNKGSGIHIRGAGSNANRILGNEIGTTLDGTASLSNSNGVIIEQSASNNVVGDITNDSGPLGNLISGNRGYGVALNGIGTTGNLVQDNKIGTDLAGFAAVGNNLDGVLIATGASGNVIGGASNGLRDLTAAGNLISGNNLDGVGIVANGTSNNKVQGNRIGTDLWGFMPLPNLKNGVVVSLSASNNIIGGDNDAQGNLISANGLSGVVLSAGNNYVTHNRIGTVISTIAPLPNGLDGVDLPSSGNGVGWNVISGNQNQGIDVSGSSNIIVSNKVGTDSSGTLAVGNLHDGILIEFHFGTGGNRVGFPISDAGNLISGNGWNGIEVTGAKSTDNWIQNNRIGTALSGLTSLPNGRNGIFVNDTSSYTIGGSDPQAGNLVSGNTLDGILITGRHSTGIVVLGNHVGTNLDGSSIVPNAGNGIHLDKGADNEIIGGLGATDGNLISGNVLDGILVGSNINQGSKILGNRIGTDAGGLFALPNLGHGIEIVGASQNVIGGAAPGSGNLISGNRLDGIRLDKATLTLVAGNLIGTDITGTQAVGNQGNGIELVHGSAKNTIGGVPTTTAMPGNVISGNLAAGLVISDPGTTGNLVQGNEIGTTLSGNVPLGNTVDGVDILNGASFNTIGGSGGVGLGAPGNVITANGGDGVRIWGSGSSNNYIQGNRIGTYATDQAWKGNIGHGVWVALGAQSNFIGGSTSAKGNVIANNGKAGVAVGNFVMDATTLHNPIQSNSIYGNTGLGIDLGDDGVTTNTPGGPHVGPNQFQNYPVITSATATAGATTITISLNSAPNKQFLLQVFSSDTPDPSGYGQGKTFVGSVLLTTNSTGNGTATLLVPASLAGQWVTATATSASGDTSEFGRTIRVGGSGSTSSSGGGGAELLSASAAVTVPSVSIHRPTASGVVSKVQLGAVVGGPRELRTASQAVPSFTLRKWRPFPSV